MIGFVGCSTMFDDDLSSITFREQLVAWQFQ